MEKLAENLIKAEAEIKQVLKKYRVNLADLKQRKALAAWESMAGIWKGRKLPDAVKWQRKIRKEWDRQI